MRNILHSSNTIHFQNKCLNQNASSVKWVKLVELVKTQCCFVNVANTEDNDRTSLS